MLWSLSGGMPHDRKDGLHTVFVCTHSVKKDGLHTVFVCIHSVRKDGLHTLSLPTALGKMVYIKDGLHIVFVPTALGKMVCILSLYPQR